MGLAPLAQDRGLRTGEFTLYPSIGLMGHHDTNLFNGNDQEASNPPRGATSIRILPRLTLLNDPGGDIAFTFNGSGDARIYPSDNASIKAQQNVGGNVALEVAIGRRRPISFTLFEYFGRTLRANNWETIATLNRLSNDVGARVEFHPGDIPERRPFNLAFAASYAFDSFESFNSGNTSTLRTRLSGSWKFLPKTAAVLDSTWDFRSYTAGSALVQSGLAANSKPFRVRTGLTGALSKRIATQALVGWGLSTHASGDSFNGLLASVGVGVRASENTRLYVGYDRDYNDSFFANFSSYHRGYFSLKQRFGHVLDVSGSFGVRALSYGALAKSQPGFAVTGLTTCDGGACRRDTALEGNLTANFELARLMSMNIGYNLRSVQTNFKIRAGGVTGAVLDTGAYTAHELFATLFLRY